MINATEKYGRLTSGGEIKVTFTQDEACVILKVNDYGVGGLSFSESDVFNALVAKLKDQIWS